MLVYVLVDLDRNALLNQEGAFLFPLPRKCGAGRDRVSVKMALRNDIRLALPSKGRLEHDALEFMDACGLGIYKPNPRQYQTTVSAIPELKARLWVACSTS